jgi:hypothetical protein
MSGTSLQKILNNAFKIAGKVTGFEFEHFRPDSYILPLGKRNAIGTVILGAAVDQNFQKHEGELDQFNLYTDPSALELGDVLHSDSLGRTYIVFDKAELHAAVGILCLDRANVLRPTLGTGDVKKTFAEICTQIPCAIKYIGAAPVPGALQGTSSTLQATAHELDLWTWIKPGTIELNDVIDIDGVRYLCTFIQSTAKGTKIKMRSTKVGK